MHTTPPEIATVADLMSHGVQTVAPDATLTSVIRRLRLIGHEGFPVVENGQVIGLLTRRDADHALEHGLGNLTARNVMNAGAVTLRPNDPVRLLVRRMVESGWGQIPVVSEAGALLGVVTRTDLIKHWAQIQAAQEITGATISESISLQEAAAVLGEPAARLIELVAAQAREQSLNLYMVGGVVRDLLLKRPNDDIDFVVEGEAIPFAENLRARYGGEIHSYRPFGTATWQIQAASIYEAGVPDSVDFASARSEFYEHPTALPTVYSGSIKLDLQRRDFTINTLAMLLHPVMGEIVDYYGGLSDLRAGLIRVLHSLSFVDDPTRILRAVRFEKRLGFSIEPRTAELIETALPMLRRITGERIRNELSLVFRMSDPADVFLALQARGILKAIHPEFILPDDLAARFERAKTPPAWLTEVPDRVALGWVLLLASVPLDELTALTERLMIGKGLAEMIHETALLVQGGLPDDATPSQIVATLDQIHELSLYASWIIYENPMIRQQIETYAGTWRHMRPKTDGHALQARGIKPSPCYSIILARLRTARLDGDVTDDAGEARLLDNLLEGGICDDGA